MKEDEFLKKLSKIIPDLVYSDSLLDSESIEIPIYFSLDLKGDVMLDEECMQEEFENKLEEVKKVLENE